MDNHLEPPDDNDPAQDSLDKMSVAEEQASQLEWLADDGKAYDMWADWYRNKFNKEYAARKEDAQVDAAAERVEAREYFADR